MKRENDPNKKPVLDPEALALAHKLGLRPVQVVCEKPEPGGKESFRGSFIAFVHFLPQIGERLILGDGVYQVKRVSHSAVTEDNMTSLEPVIVVSMISGV